MFLGVVSGRWLRCQIGYDHLPEIISSKFIYRTVLSLALALALDKSKVNLAQNNGDVKIANQCRLYYYITFIARIRHGTKVRNNNNNNLYCTCVTLDDQSNP